jgi:transmembrane 9 superfamily protein 2/4
MLSVFVGNGAQLCVMTGVTLGSLDRWWFEKFANVPIVFALFGFLSPSNRGSIATVMMVCWTFFGG